MKVDKNIIYVHKFNHGHYKIYKIASDRVIWMVHINRRGGMAIPYPTHSLNKYFSISIKDILKEL